MLALAKVFADVARCSNAEFRVTLRKGERGRELINYLHPSVLAKEGSCVTTLTVLMPSKL